MTQDVSNVKAISLILTLACLGPGQETCMSLNADVDSSGPACQLAESLTRTGKARLGRKPKACGVVGHHCSHPFLSGFAGQKERTAAAGAQPESHIIVQHISLQKQEVPLNSPSPSSALANSIRLYGPAPPPKPDCLGGPPTLKNPLRLLPTFQTVTEPSWSETVIRRLPSGENVTDDTAV
jgi:hypothetical protein